MSVSLHEIRVQAGTAAGGDLPTKFTATTTPAVVLRGVEELNLRPDNNTGVLDDMSQGLSGSSTAVVRGIGATGGVQGWASYEHICYWLDNLCGQATPSGSDPYTYAYAAPTTTAPTPRILPLVKGDSTVGAYQMVGALLTRFKLTLEPDDVLKFDGDLIGNKLVADALESLSAPTVYPIMASQVSSLYWDAWGGTMGSTALADCTLRSMELEIQPDRNARSCVGSTSRDRFIEGPWTGTLMLSLEFNSTTKTDVDAIIGGTLTQKQFEANFTDGDRSLQLQFAGTVTEGPEIFGDDDGVVTVDITLERTYHATFGNWFAASVDNALSSLT